jgi:hypothetical protein
MTAALPMGSNKITGMADPTVSTDGATKNYVDTTTAAFFSTGDGKITLKTVADTGWILCDDGTFGSASSGASNLASGTTLALFTLFFNNLSDTAAPLLTSGGSATTRAGQTNAATAWAANCRMTLTKQLGRNIAIAGAGAGLTSRPLGGSAGLETATLVTANLPPYTPSGSVAITQINITGLNVSGGGANTLTPPGTGSLYLSSGAFTGTAQGGTSTPISIIPPEAYWNCMIKL